ncbi:MAG: tetratricopeptide repeat protein [Alloprevotella sp.]|nr:tetratricopeptide repeat protein [Alloprevotella sp.]
MISIKNRFYIYFFSCILLATFPLLKVSGKTASLQRADSLYEQGNYLEATKEYEDVIDTNPSFVAYYNLGNSYYRQKQLGKAILNYERAIRRNPTSADVRFNLALCKSKAIDSYDTRSNFFFIDWLQKLRDKLSTNQWGRLGLLLAVLASLFFYIFIRNKSVARRKFFFTIFMVSIIFFVVVNALAYWQWHDYNRIKQGVIIVEQETLYSSPDNSAKSLSEIHEGTIVNVNNKKEGWLFITLPDESAGWITADALEII